MKRLNSNVGSFQATLEKRPEVLKAIGMYATVHVLNSVVYDFVLELIAESLVSARSPRQ